MMVLRPTIGRTVAFLERNAWRGLTAIFAYAVLTSAFTRDVQIQLFEQNANDQHVFQGILARSDKGYDFFDFSPMNYDLGTSDLQENTPMDINSNFLLTSVAASQLSTMDTLPAVHIGGPDALVVRDGQSASVYSPEEAKHYPLVEDEAMRAVTTTGNHSIIYTTLQDGILDIHYLMQCKEPVTVSMSGLVSVTAADIERMGLPLQNELYASPTENHLLVLDHAFDSHVWLVNVESGGMERLNPPGFGDGQIHAAPIFIDAKTVAFSTWETDRGATFFYHMDEGRYEQVSDVFSDDIYVSTKGEPVFTQSISRAAGTIPYGSVTMIRERAYVERQVVQTLFGEDNSWMQLFADPQAENLRFLPAAKDLFRTIEDPTKRMQITKLWNDIHDPFIQHENTLRILTLTKDGLQAEASMLYFTDTSVPFFHWKDATALLQALHVPENIIREFAAQREKKVQNGDTYILHEIR